MKSTTIPIPETPLWARRCFETCQVRSKTLSSHEAGGAESLSRSRCASDAPGAFSSVLLERPGLSLASYRVPNAAALEAEAFEEACYRIYRGMAEDLEKSGARHPIRLWNFIPRILDPLGELEHRYMVFNAGRFRALEEWLGPDHMASRVATASGVGHFGADLTIHCLASDVPGEPVENPRQRPAYRYSPKFGPLPPCFARATRWENGDETPWLLVGGTASVRGEESFHTADLRRQLDETFYNLAALVRSGHGLDCPHLSPDEVRALLRSYRDLRIYIVDPDFEDDIRGRLSRLVPGETQLEFIHADLCRPELLVEIEGVATLGVPPVARS